MPNTNYWTSHKDGFAKWYCRFPIVKNTSDVERMVKFTRRCVELGEAERILMIRKNGWTPIFDNSSGETYADFVERIVAESGQLPLFNIGIPGKAVVAADICFYDEQGHLIQEEISNMELLLRRVRSDAVDNPLVSFNSVAWPCPPLSVWGYQTLPISPPPQRDRGPVICVEICTDIWFPEVGGYLEKISVLETGNLFDNRELAQCHTPRFNRFLLGVHQATLELGGIWNFYPEECRGQYRYMLTDTGIRLNI